MGLEARLEYMASCLDLPGIQLLGGLMLVKVEGTNADDLIVLLVDVDSTGVAPQAEAVKAQALDYGSALHIIAHAPSPLMRGSFYRS